MERNKVIIVNGLKANENLTYSYTLSGHGFCFGYDSGDAMNKLYPVVNNFNTGPIDFVGITVEGTPYINLETEAKRAVMSH